MTQPQYITRINAINKTLEIQRQAADIAAHTEAQLDLPAVPAAASYTDLSVERSQWDTTKLIVRGTIGDNTFTREIDAAQAPVVRSYAAAFQRVQWNAVGEVA